MRIIHLIFGIALFVVFTITGRFMRVDFPDKDAIDQSFRLLMRSRHIYILFAALIHVALGVYLTIRPQRWRKALQVLGSFLLFIAGGLLVWAFFAETYQFAHFSDISRQGIFLSLAGIILHLVGGFSTTRVAGRT